MKSVINIAMAGFGVVGSGTLQLLQEHKKSVEARVGAKINISWVLSRSRKKSSLIPKTTRQTTRWQDIVSDPSVDCLVEVIGGINPARDLMIAALRAGQHVVTANKAILSNHWNDVFKIAKTHHRLVYIEAAVGGGIPVIQALNEGLAGNRIRKIEGILNGTTNYILTRMQNGQTTFKQALKEAQKAGFAEANPKFDIQGIDAAQKISILASLAAGGWIPPQSIHTDGISHLHPYDIRFIEGLLKHRIKLLGIAEETPDGWLTRVHPTLIPHSHPFANVSNEYNAVSLHGNAVGDVMLYGKGAGKSATSSALLSDLIFLCRQIANETDGQFPYIQTDPMKKIPLAEMSNVHCRYYLRMTTRDKPGILSRITGVLGHFGVSIASVHQDTYQDKKIRRGVPIVLITHYCQESNLQKAIRQINALKSTTEDTVILRME